jgi:hypothetical protein
VAFQRAAVNHGQEKKVTMVNYHNKNAKESENPEDIMIDNDDISERTAQMGVKWDYIALVDC